MDIGKVRRKVFNVLRIKIRDGSVKFAQNQSKAHVHKQGVGGRGVHLHQSASRDVNRVDVEYSSMHSKGSFSPFPLPVIKSLINS